jgi:hypothetical protein
MARIDAFDLYIPPKGNIVTCVTKRKTNFFNFFQRLSNQLLFLSSALLFKKLKFRGKGYYVFRGSRGTVAFKFGYAHRMRIYVVSFLIKLTAKTAILLRDTNAAVLHWHATRLKTPRPINIFTSKGVRFTRQVTYKKTGKIGSYR